MSTHLRSLPKVLLHDHIDGGLRPRTVLELAQEAEYGGLPATTVDELANWFHQGESGGLARYLAAFDETLAVMQSASAMRRAATEAVLDLTADGVVYAELRFDPILHTHGSLDIDGAIESVSEGVTVGSQATDTPIRLIVSALRQERNSVELAEAALRHRDAGVVGFDLAGVEEGNPATDHRKALDIARGGGLHLTIHAGEGAGIESISAALDCGAERLGHGVRIIEDCVVVDGEIVDLGPVATRVHEQRILLEASPTSNVHTRAVPDADRHPLGLLMDAGFVMTINTDNRLMSATSMSAEFDMAMVHQGLDLDDLQRLTLNAVDGAFCEADLKRSLRRRVVDGYPS